MPQPISPEHAAKIRQLFGEVCEMPEAERAEFIDRACRDEASLRHELTSLLRHAGSDYSPVDDFAQEVVTPMLEALRDGPAGLSALLDEVVGQGSVQPKSCSPERDQALDLSLSLLARGSWRHYCARSSQAIGLVSIYVPSRVSPGGSLRDSRYGKELRTTSSLAAVD